jgi:cytochrome P450 family 4
MNETATEKYFEFSSWIISCIQPTVFAITALILLHIYHETSHKARLARNIPGPFALPFLGNVLLLLGLKSNHHVYRRVIKLSDKFGRVVRGWAGWRLIIFLLDPSDVEVILNSQAHIDKSEEYDFFKPWLGNGLLISTGEKWKTHRKLIAPAFHMNILKSFMPTFNNNSKRVVEKLRLEKNKEFDCHDQLSEATVDILLETVMGFKKSNKEKTRSGFDYAMAVMRMCDIIHQRHFRLWYRPSLIFNMSRFKKIQNEALNVIHGLTSEY